MGIPGIYEEIGKGERIALVKLATEKLEQTGHPLRIAIDVSIWQFQIQAGQGGSNPAIRTLYYRLLRLLSLSIHPLFVFDGPNKPKVKRGKRVGCSSVPNIGTKQLLKLFGFPYHTAPGEAEAECALLQRHGIVDAVLSEDVDTLMFGCGITLRDWSSEGKGNKSPTHVSMFDAKKTKEGKSGLDREGMILVALLSGGDYDPAGLPGFGTKVACQAARAGYGKSLCNLSRTDVEGLEAWRITLNHEIQTNESKLFKTKHKSLTIPDNFPSKEILGFYTHPVVSTALKVEKLKDDILWDGEINIVGLRAFVKDNFDWTNKAGATKFVRTLAPPLLAHKLRVRGNRRDSGYGDLVLTAMNEMELVRAICGKRAHFSTDGMPELRVVYHPLDIVGINLDDECDDTQDYGRDGLAPLNDDEQIESYVSDVDAANAASPTRRAPAWDPTQPDKAWLPESVARIGVPLKVEDYEESLRDPKKFLKQKAAAKRAATKKPATKGGMPMGALDQFVKATKLTRGIEDAMADGKAVSASQPMLPPVYLAPTLERLTASQPPTARPSARTGSSTSSFPGSSKARSKTTQPSKPKPQANPWTLAKPSSSQPRATITKSLPSQSTKSIRSPSPPPFRHAAIDLCSSPPSSPPSPLPHPQKSTDLSRSSPKKHSHSPSPPASPPPPLEEEELELPSTVTISRGAKASGGRSGGSSTPSKSHVNGSAQAQRDLPTCRPSPRKKVSPNSKSSSVHDSTTYQEIQQLSPEPVARRLEFSPAVAVPYAEDLKHEYSYADGDDVYDYGDEYGDGDEDDCIFPDIKDLLSPPPPRPTTPTLAMNKNAVIELDSSPPQPPPHLPMPRSHQASVKEKGKRKTKQGKRYIIIRDSLAGAWKEVGEDEVEQQEKKRIEKERGGEGKSRARWRMSEIECLDLSED